MCAPYQRANVRFINGLELTNLAVFNAEELHVPDEFAKAEIEDVRLHVG